MPLRGTLSEVGIEEILEWIEGSRKTGALELENDRFRKAIFFVEGAIGGISSTEPSDSLVHRLFGSGLLSRAQMEAADYVQRRTGRPLVDILYRTGALDAAELEKGVETQAKEALWSLFLWDSGRFCFRDDELPGDLPAAVSLRAGPLLHEGVRRRARAAEIRAGFPQGAPRVGRGMEPTEVVMGSPLDEEVMQLVSEPRSLLSLMLETRATEFALLETVARLIEVGAVRFVVEPSAQAEQEGPLGSGSLAASRVPRAPATSGALASARAERTAVGLLEREEAEEYSAASPEEAARLLAAARHQMELHCYEHAVELFRAARAADPRLASLLVGAESVYAEVLFRGELPALACPVRVLPTDEIQHAVSPGARSMLEKMDGSVPIQKLVTLSGEPQLEALLRLRDLRRWGLIEFGGVPQR